MLKLLVLFALTMAATYANPFGGLYGQPVITKDVMEIAEWCTNELTTTYNQVGDHRIINIREYTYQIVTGKIHRFIIDYIVHGSDNSYEVTCLITN